MSKVNEEAARVWLQGRREKLVGEIELLKGRLKEVDWLLGQLHVRPGQQQGRRQAQVQIGEQPTALPPGLSDALARVGKDGISAEQLALQAGIPRGTASSRLSTLKGKGFLTHKKLLYFPAEQGQEQVAR